MANIPAGKSFRLSAASTTSTSYTITSDVPVNAWEFLNDGAQPIQVKFFIGNTGTVVFPTAGSPDYDITLQHGAVSNPTVYLPQRLVNACSGLGGFTTTVNISVIAASGTQGLNVTAVQVPNKQG
ncbi:hypothetical protein UFOVP94_34 [uncultured Caudovirales phage]|uniref:Uncharacterized protein n=1 Tax=uncultured Caudovirales phage TaxID=2100421 RepID=A0A6J5L325_9CAUD|nr:hypothetical protein UFOVP94_34 [uncultured Caudovirales phage]CAB5212381.1 hypothetical protein UFOVP186_9 [uncultured Caudovirales phage]